MHNYTLEKSVVCVFLIKRKNVHVKIILQKASYDTKYDIFYDTIYKKFSYLKVNDFIYSYCYIQDIYVYIITRNHIYYIYDT